LELTPTKLKNREELPQLLSQVIEQIKHDKTKVDIIKENLRTEYKILPGKIQKIITNSEEELRNVSDELLYLLTNEVYIVTGDMEIKPDSYYKEREIKEIKTNFEVTQPEKIEFPYTFTNVNRVDFDDYLTIIKASEIKHLFENGLLQYNFETQREARQHKDNDTGSIIETPKIVEKSVKEMEELFIKDEIISSVITFNARLGSSNEGEELIFDNEKHALTVTKGTLLDVLDGFHRINAIVRALRKNPSVDKTFKLNILNFNKEKARQYFGQMNTTNPVSKAKIEEYRKTREGSTVADYLKYNSLLKGLIASGDHISYKSDLLVTFNTLSEGIDDIYEIDNRADAIKVSRYLTEFFNKLFESFPDEFLGNIAEVRENSLINTNAMFYGYILLSKRMKDDNVELDKLSDIIKSINFSRTNKIWQKFKVIDSTERITNRAKKHIYDYFTQIKIK
jgi:hypothetical protein